jgi:hypothetical protein
MPAFLIVPAIILLGLDQRSSYSATIAAQAYLRQSGIDRMLNEYQERELSPQLRARLGQATFVIKTLTEQKVTYTWGFP